MNKGKNMYNIGDVIYAKINDFTLLGERYKHHVRGTIVEIYSENDLNGYDIQLFEPEIFEQYIPSPLTEKYQKYHKQKEQEYGKELKELDIIFVNHIDVIKYYPSNKILGVTFRRELQDTWKNLVFRKIKAVIRKNKNLENIEYVYSDNNVESGLNCNLNVKKYRNFGEAFQEVSKEDHKNIFGIYKNYYGFTNSKKIFDNDKYNGNEIFFSKRCYNELDLDNNATANFRKKKMRNKWCPHENQIICGLVEKGEKGYFYRKWFICSPQFKRLWKLIMYADNSVSNNIYKIQNILQSLSIEINKNVFNCEQIIFKYPKRYQDIFKMSFIDSEIYDIQIQKKEFDQKSKNNILYGRQYRSFKETLYNNIMWMLK